MPLRRRIGAGGPGSGISFVRRSFQGTQRSGAARWWEMPAGRTRLFGDDFTMPAAEIDFRAPQPDWPVDEVDPGQKMRGRKDQRGKARPYQPLARCGPLAGRLRSFTGGFDVQLWHNPWS